jgi:predicted RNA-binding Zn-ribbon protein involved in translation (DUF1610 family)
VSKWPLLARLYWPVTFGIAAALWAIVFNAYAIAACIAGTAVILGIIVENEFTCPKCGKRHRLSAWYCPECGNRTWRHYD